LHGFTKDPDSNNYMAIMDYANHGNLRKYLTKIIKFNWNVKLQILYKIIAGLDEIHKQNLIHCDFHDGNILQHYMKTYVSDLGLCHPLKSSSEKNSIYGVMPFMAPEILRGNSYTSASDIYSFSMIMWEFTSGISPFNDKEHNLQLALSICKGERPKIIENTPQCYMNLMKKCWNDDLLKRPPASEILNIIKEWIHLASKTKIENINEELKNNVMEFINAPIGNNEPITESHPQAYYISRLFNFNSKELNEILESEKSECIDCKINTSKELNDEILESEKNKCMNYDKTLESEKSQCMDCIINDIKSLGMYGKMIFC
jgi:serine/threonine protein kinase